MCIRDSTTSLTEKKRAALRRRKFGFVFQSFHLVPRMTAAQNVELPLNLDGIKDIIVFDRSGNKLSPYININGDFIFAPEYRTKFPSIESWIILEDYNCDGMNDIFTY